MPPRVKEDGKAEAKPRTKTKRQPKNAPISTGRNHYLLEAVIATKTWLRYRAAVTDFVNWAMNCGAAETSADDLDELMLEYIHELHASGIGRSRASDTVFGVMAYVPKFRFVLPASRRALLGWQRLEPSVSWPPLTWELALVISLQLARHRCFNMAVATLVCFDCLLRISELTSLRFDDVADEADARVSIEHKGMILRLRHTKTGDNQEVRVLDSNVLTLMRFVLSRVDTTKSDGPLFGCSADQYRRKFKLVCAELGLTDYVVHSLRHGGATRYYHVLNMPLADVVHRGRWKGVKSAEHYIQTGRAALMAKAAPDQFVKLGATLSKGSVISSMLIALAQ